MRRRLSAACIQGAAWLLLSACTPTEVDQRVFPALAQTCYAVPVADVGRAFWADQTERPLHCTSGGALTPGAAGSGSAAAAIDLPPEGAAGAPPRDGPFAALDAGPSPVGTDAGADAAVAAAPACSEQRVRALFAAEFNVGGCQDSELGGCHGNDSAANGPHFLAADLRAELLGHVSDSEDCSGQIWITPGGGLEGSLLWNKVSSVDDDPGNAPRCGKAMPPREDGGMPVPAAELECLRAWILQLAASG